MNKEFTIKNIDPFDLLRLSKDEFYKVMDEQYKIQFGKDIEINEVSLSFVDNGIKIIIKSYN